MTAYSIANRLADVVHDFRELVNQLPTRKEQDAAFEVLHSVLAFEFKRGFASEIYDAIADLVEWKEEEE